MSDVMMRRNDYKPIRQCEHAGLFLLKGFKAWKLSGNGAQALDADGNHNRDIAEHHNDAAQIPPPDIYNPAYERWKNHLVGQGNVCGHWFGELAGRMYLGLGEASPLEAGITLHHTYGVPIIPGTAVKGALHHYAIAHGMPQEHRDIIFGREPNPDNENDQGEAGYAIFNDAWWVPGQHSPLVPEVVTVHHQNYYSSGGEKPATDFDDPNPNSQMAISGSFHFSYFADEALHAVVSKLFEEALQHWGIGGKTSSGYGLFVKSETLENSFTKWKQKYELDNSSADQKVDLLIEHMQIKEVPERFGKKRNTTAKELDRDEWEKLIAGVKAKFGETIAQWENSSNKNEVKAYKTIYSGAWQPDWEELVKKENNK